ncbi:GntR family transcriptional regulator [Roseomonas sp. GC11]|uniref:GntR family transcriptional regulator n=1 Tax=Roseomonas sp. GC11 TaxID=2950546 RepID=UPI00210D6797|nr:GntR family transcriptional regulator [Roseomonas sp. GC11]MCQ4158849.1 GntR family transcriptional regulator [Roseomonas sp. GC11]
MLKAQTTQDLVVEALRADIAQGRIPPGAALRQEDLAARFAVSRIPIREALRRLESEGLVRVFPNRGAFVVELSPAEIQEITDLRAMVEADLACRAVPRLTEAALARIATSLEVAERAAATLDWSATDRAFHASLYAPAERPRQLALAMGLRGEVERYAALYRHLPEGRESWLRDHRAIAAAFARRDAVAARDLVAAHVAAAGAFLIAAHAAGHRG